MPVKLAYENPLPPSRFVGIQPVLNELQMDLKKWQEKDTPQVRQSIADILCRLSSEYGVSYTTTKAKFRPQVEALMEQCEAIQDEAIAEQISHIRRWLQEVPQNENASEA